MKSDKNVEMKKTEIKKCGCCRLCGGVEVLTDSGEKLVEPSPQTRLVRAYLDS